MNKIPVFLHIPKSGGTYFLSWAMSMFRLWTQKQELYNGRYLISVKHNDLIVLSVIACVKNCTNFINNPNDNYNIIIDLDKFLLELSKKEIKIFFIMIEPDGFFMVKNRAIEYMCNIVEKYPIYHMTIRDSFSRCQSLYNYLNHKNSSHELFHGDIKYITLRDYIHSDKLEDSWLIRVLNNIPDSESISEQHFDEVCTILDNFKIKDIQEIDSLIDEIFEECYSMARKDVLPIQIIINRNETKMPKIDFSELDNETQEIFLRRTEFDRDLYKKYCM